mgnify:CR=1 FL=1
MELEIKQLAFFGDSYCFESKNNDRCPIYTDTVKRRGLSRSQAETYIDMLSDQLQLPVVNFGYPGHGPMWTVHELLEWLDNHKNEIHETYFVFCWSDIRRQLIKSWKTCTEPSDHPGEEPILGPDSPTLTGSNIDPKYVEALQLYYVYLHTEQDLTRRGRIVYHALQNIFRDYKIDATQRQEYFCFNDAKWLNNQTLPFVYNGVEFDSLYRFAQHFDDYGVQGVDDLLYCNHFSEEGHKGITEVIRARYEKHISKRM